LIDLYGPDPRTNPDYSRVITAREVSRLAGLIDPVKVTAGGRSDPDARYLDPTILYPVAWDDPIMEDEVFGPILPILTYRTLDEALARIAATPHPLAAFVFSRDRKTIDRFIGELSYGGGAVNQVNIHLFIESMPFGGTGAAGIGHYYGKYGFDMLTHAQVNAHCATRGGDRPPLSAVHEGEERSADALVRLLTDGVRFRAVLGSSRGCPRVYQRRTK
jgi:aldehyde dehydrogenase (NAD+)